jgi:hypothetical protein
MVYGIPDDNILPTLRFFCQLKNVESEIICDFVEPQYEHGEMSGEAWRAVSVEGVLNPR